MYHHGPTIEIFHTDLFLNEFVFIKNLQKLPHNIKYVKSLINKICG